MRFDAAPCNGADMVTGGRKQTRCAIRLRLFLPPVAMSTRPASPAARVESPLWLCDSVATHPRGSRALAMRDPDLFKRDLSTLTRHTSASRAIRAPSRAIRAPHARSERPHAPYERLTSDPSALTRHTSASRAIRAPSRPSERLAPRPRDVSRRRRRGSAVQAAC
jgi:hypothetical protein